MRRFQKAGSNFPGEPFARLWAFPIDIHLKSRDGTEGLDRRPDLYSFAVLTLQLPAGHKLFERSNTRAMICSHLEEPPRDPRL